MAWTEEELALAKQLNAEGLSSSEISRELGIRLHSTKSRCAVIGKLDRVLGKDKVRIKQRHAKNGRLTFKTSNMDGTGRLHIAQLERQHCRWPFGEKNFTFCGAQKAEGSSYCPEHTLLALPRHHGGNGNT